MFVLDEDKKFLTTADLVMARLYNSDINNRQVFQNYNREPDAVAIDDYDDTSRHLIREQVKHLGWMVEFPRDSAYPNRGSRNFFQRNRIGFHVTEDTHVVSVWSMMQNHNHRDNRLTDYLRPTMIFHGTSGFAVMQTESQADMDWWFSHMPEFRYQPQLCLILH